MSLWLVRAIQHEYDEYDSFVIRAENETEARKMAEAKAIVGGGTVGGRYQWRGFWLDPAYVTVTLLEVDGLSEIIIGSFNAG